MLVLCQMLTAQTRREINLKTWEFSRNQTSWTQVNIPHDWAIAGPFDKKWDLQRVAIEQNGETEATEKSGRSGALPWIGEGWYKTTVKIPQGYEAAELVFDGAMAEPRVSINGQEAGYWAYGYNAFRVDATPYIKSGKLDISVHLQNIEESSRWYPGAGLYRPVTLILKQKAHFDDWSLFARTISIEKDKTIVEVEGRTVNARGMHVFLQLAGPDGRKANNEVRIEHDGKFYAKFVLRNPQLWTPETPNLYDLKVWLGDMKNTRRMDSKTMKIGVRTVRIDREHGFQLNGVTRKIKGVCLHHDLGPLGAAINKSALIRQIKMLKQMGCDAIRTSHNMPSTWQMDVCDSLGMMVMAESFDMWIYPKCKNGYARFFKEWAVKDLTNLILNQRNHPSIVMWSIGNEIPEQNSEAGRQISIQLQGLCHSLDPTRPVTQGMDRADEALKSGFAQVMELPGFNYRVHRYANNIKQLSQGFLLGSETASTVSSRGVYKFPVEITDNSQYASWSPNYDPTAILKADGQCSSYDTEYCSWSNLPDDDWVWQDDYDWVIGEFVWTGYDYLGEPTPYDEYWPSRSSYFGICDLAGLPKDRYYLYKSRWNKQEHTVHLLPHWTWPDRKGKVTPVYCYTDGVEGELFVNGKSQGRIRKNPKERLDRYRLRWNDVKYEPGEIRVVAYDEQGNVVGEDVRQTAGKAVQLVAQAETAEHQADGEDLIYVRVSVEDKNGVPVPTCQEQLTFSVSGEANFEAACNGDATSLESFKQPRMKLFNGELVIILRPTTKAGKATLTVKDQKGRLKPAVLTIETQKPETSTFWLGADISGTTDLEARKVQLFNAKGEPRECTELMHELGLNAVRLRVWVNPKDGLCNKEDVVKMALRAKKWGMAVMIDFHYSDWWADPGQQNIPAAWTEMNYEQMKQALADHTRDVLRAINQAGVDVRWVQVGNETTNGFLWPMGRAQEHMDQYAGLTDAGYGAVKEVFPRAEVIVHLDGAFDPKRYDFIFDGLEKYKARYDIIGLSVYPYWDIRGKHTQSWQETVEKATANINRLWEKYHKPMLVVETGAEASKPIEGKQIIAAIIDMAKNKVGGHCQGVFYWAPETDGPYRLGAFQNNQPTAIMDAFTEAAQQTTTR
jgi:beta-galactosidase